MRTKRLAGAVLLGTLSACQWGPPTPLTRAAGAGDVSAVEALLRHGAAVDARDGMGGTALIAAARHGHVGVMRVLIEAGASVDLPDSRTTRWPPLVHAIHKRQDAAARLLLDSGARADPVLPGGATPLIFAAVYGETAVVEDLLSRGADPHRRTKDGMTALAGAAGAGRVFDVTDGPELGTCHLDTVKALLRNSPDLTLPPGFWSRTARVLGQSWECKAAFALLAEHLMSDRGAPGPPR